MNTGARVSYQGESYSIFFDYGNGYVEIQKENERYTIECVHITELRMIKDEVHHFKKVI